MAYFNVRLYSNLLQCFAFALGMGIGCGFPSLYTTLVAVACTQLDKVRAAILNIRQEHITSRIGQEDEQVHTDANCSLQDKINSCIRHHQKTMA
jgi:hypothetical protein